MVPRTDVVFIERNKTLRQAISLACAAATSRIPVVGENLDDVVGFTYLKDLTRRVFDRHEAEQTERVESVMRPVMYVPDSKPVDALLREMQAERKHVAVVVDEYGGTAGLVTIEDVLEEIVGEITDEYDVEHVDVEHLANGSTGCPRATRSTTSSTSAAWPSRTTTSTRSAGCWPSTSAGSRSRARSSRRTACGSRRRPAQDGATASAPC